MKKKKILRQTVSQLEAVEPIKAQVARDTQALILPIDAIKVGDNIRKDLGDLTELVESVQTHGIIQALLVRKSVGGLELIAGHRRLEAAKRAGLREVPVRVANADENDAAVLRLVENIQRQDLTGPEEILAVAKLSSIFPDQTQLAKAIGRSRSYVSRCLKAAELIYSNKVATSQLSKSALFEIADSADAKKALEQIGGAEKTTVQAVRQGRKPSGAIPGGHAVDRVVRYNERRGGMGFTLKVHFDFDKSSDGDRQRLLNQLRQLITRLELKPPAGTGV